MADLRKDVRGAIAGQRDRTKAEDLDAPSRPPGRQVRTPGADDVELLWNLTDDPNVAGGATARNIPVGGSTLRPGQALQAPSGTVESNAKLAALVTSGLLFMGPRPPEAYLLAKNKIRVKAPRGAALRPTKQGGLARQIAEAEGAAAKAALELAELSAEQARIRTILDRNKADSAYCRSWAAKLEALEPKVARAVLLNTEAERALTGLRGELTEALPPVPQATVQRLSQRTEVAQADAAPAVEPTPSSGRRSGRRSRSGD